MDVADIYASAPGSRFLAACPSGAQEDMLYWLIPVSIHDACIHRGGRSHSGTKR